MTQPPRNERDRSGFNRLWAAESLGFFGVQVALFVLPLVAVFTQNATPAQLGILGAAFFLPNLVFGLIAGARADRHDRRSMLLQAELLSAICVLAVPIAAALDLLSVELLYGVSFLLGSATVHFNAASFAILPGLVGRDDLVTANSRLQLSVSTSRVAGPALGGVLVQVATAPVALVLSTVSFVLCGLSLLVVPPVHQEPPASRSQPIWREIASGLRFVGSRRAIAGTATYTAASGGFAAASFAQLPLYASDLSIGPSSLGLVVACAGAGGIVGSIISGSMPRWLRLETTIAISALAIALAQWGIPFAGILPELALPVLSASRFIYGAATVVNAMHVISLQQGQTPDELQGRMYATVRFVINSGAILGTLTGGIVGQVFGLPQTMVLSALGTTAAVLWLTFAGVKSARVEPDRA